MLRVTTDTNVLDGDLARMKAACAGLDVEILPTTVTLRETGKSLPPSHPVVPESGVYGESLYDSGAVYADAGAVMETGVWDESIWGEFVWGPSPAPVRETFVLDESRLDEALLGDEAGVSRFETILAIISNRSFPPPGQRDTLTGGQRRQLRDAMILDAHARERRHVLVSDDVKAFIGKEGRKRVALERLCRTRIRTVAEFCDEASALAAQL